jgi:hypothetical protein
MQKHFKYELKLKETPLTLLLMHSVCVGILNKYNWYLRNNGCNTFVGIGIVKYICSNSNKYEKRKIGLFGKCKGAFKEGNINVFRGWVHFLFFFTVFNSINSKILVYS